MSGRHVLAGRHVTTQVFIASPRAIRSPQGDDRRAGAGGRV